MDPWSPDEKKVQLNISLNVIIIRKSVIVANFFFPFFDPFQAKHILVFVPRDIDVDYIYIVGQSIY